MAGKSQPRDLPFPTRLRSLRERSTLSQSELAGRAELAKSVILQIEQGRRPNPSLSTILALARGLGCPPAELVAGISAVTE